MFDSGLARFLHTFEFIAVELLLMIAGSSIGRFQGRLSILDDILPNFSFTLHPSHSKQEACHYRSLVKGLTSVLWTYVLISGHPDASWRQAVTYPLGMGVVELISLRYEMLYAAAFPRNNPDPKSKIKMR
ncbi:uncharacterized protein ARMOST_09879 [Armillaria ostoyae]|uniref:Uncharacterized protein n=1 Tax=Armillaria ostoyae TaxID=47428 RepID=A0A284RCQ3_ARMOS|nr:uncharacterized protein ARMOST_09879 [Armillaria ostoyae]